MVFESFLVLCLRCWSPGVTGRMRIQGLLCLQARHAEAVEELRKACYLAPKEAGIHFHLGSACQSLGDHVAALKHFTSALDLASSNRDRHLVEASHRELRQLRGDMDI